MQGKRANDCPFPSLHTLRCGTHLNAIRLKHATELRKVCNGLERIPAVLPVHSSNPNEGCLSTRIESYPHIKVLYVDNLLFCKDIIIKLLGLNKYVVLHITYKCFLTSYNTCIVTNFLAHHMICESKQSKIFHRAYGCHNKGQ